ncbi:MAG: Chromosome plasmid partitioning protein ParB [Candidatus Adlerbacteria bacterium]|nr:Chromosome plasmid partitioning protein ParB [Candidatus Adlerbacteria bacterium]
MLQKAQSTLREVMLPGGDTVEVSDTPLEWWPKSNESGFVDPVHIAPDPKNPRKTMNPARRAELEESVGANGVRQALVLTPRHLAPWAKVALEFANCYFIAVGGHRRREAALAKQVGAVPIMVRVYQSEKTHRLDMSLLNKGQDDLTPLEEGYEIVDLQKLGWKVDDLCKAFGYAAPQLYDRMNLTKLSPEIQKFLDPELPRRKRLSISVGGKLGGIPAPTAEELGDLCHLHKSYAPKSEAGIPDDLSKTGERELRFMMQRYLLAIITKRDLSADRAIEFIREHKLQLKSGNSSGGRPVERFHPVKRKEVLASLSSAVQGSLVVDWDELEFRRIFENASREEVEEVIRKFETSAKHLERILGILDRIRSLKKPTRPEVLELMNTNGKKKAS